MTWAISDGRVVAVGPSIDGEATRTIDATGRLVTPGFVDIHTHYDGQVTWDPLLEPSTLHGVTTIVTGNCGVGFAPVRPGTEEWLIQLMEGVEDIPGTRVCPKASTGSGRPSPSTSMRSSARSCRSTSGPCAPTARCAAT